MLNEQANQYSGKQQPPVGTPIPEGATHWDWCRVHRFQKYVGDDVYIYRDDIQPSGWHRWKKLTARHQGVELKAYEIPADAPVINTVFGPGRVLGSEACGRVIVELDNNPLGYRPAHMYPRDIIK